MANEELRAKIEAALFLTDKPIRAQAIARIVDADVDLVRRIVLELIETYEQRNGGLEVADDNGYMIQVKDEYTNLVDEFVPMDMPTALVRTLSAIALKQPVLQSEVIKLRGGGAYEHIKELTERELISKKEDGGRSPILSTTRKFQEYFRLSKDGNMLRQTLTSEAKAARALEEKSIENDLSEIPTTDIHATDKENILKNELEINSPENNDESSSVNSEVFDASPEPDSTIMSMEVADLQLQNADLSPDNI